ncbi:hypothetical protein ILUMI_24728 [Ignelater luminosus]|uniref:Uncharacterized protein n=1 Tax=Ignelater luminosus TaxID=2038154 RepID=A0A8K0FYH1_IGNLU|nr:hypothetical protein ILUMI_24728 [Ignelater luminosus]
MMFGRDIKTCLDLIRPQTQAKAAKRHIRNFRGNRDIQFTDGERVHIRNYCSNDRWFPDEIEEVLVERTYICRESKGGQLWKRHTYQLLPHSSKSDVVQSIVDLEQNVTNNDSQVDSDNVLENTVIERRMSLDKQNCTDVEVDNNIIKDNSIKSEDRINLRPRRTIKPPDRLNL